MAFNAVEAATSGFGLIRARFPSVMAWGAANLAGTIVIVVAALVVLALTIGVSALGGLAAQDPSAMGPGVISAFVLVFLVIMAGALVLASVVQCAVFRTILRPEERGFGQLRLGGDEARMLLLYLVISLLFLAGCLVLFLVQVGLSAARVGGLGVLLFIAYFLWFGTQFWLAPPMTFATRRLQIFASWGLVRGRFWPVMGALLLTLVFIIGVSLAGFVVQLAVQAMVGLNSLNPAAVGEGNAANVGAVALGSLLSLALSFVINALVYPIGIAPPATAYRDIVGPGAERQADVFS